MDFKIMIQGTTDNYTSILIKQELMSHEFTSIEDVAAHFTEFGRSIERTELRGWVLKKKKEEELNRQRAVWECVQFIVVQEQQQDVATALVFDAGWTKEKMRSLQKDSGRYDEEMNAFIDSL